MKTIILILAICIVNTVNSQGLMEFQAKDKLKIIDTKPAIKKKSIPKSELIKNYKNLSSQYLALFSADLSEIDETLKAKLSTENTNQLKAFTKSNACSTDLKFKIDSIRAGLIEASQFYNIKYNKLEKFEKYIKTENGIEPEKIKSNSNKLDSLLKLYETLNKEIDSVFAISNDNIKGFEKLCTNDESPITFTPELTNILGGGGLILPSANLLGTQQFKRGPLFGIVKLFSTSVIKDKPVDWRSMAIPENSAFGILADITWALRHKEGPKRGELKNTAFHFGFNYLTKRGFNDSQLPIPPENDYDFALLQMKIGLDYVAFKDIMEIYGDYNMQHIITNLGAILTNASSLYGQRNNLGYINTGVRFKIDLAGIFAKASNQKSIVFDLNLNWVSKQLKAINPEQINKITGKVVKNSNSTNDDFNASQLVIPTIKLALNL